MVLQILCLAAQRPDSLEVKTRKSKTPLLPAKDTLQYFYLGDIEKVYDFGDTTLHDFEKFNPIRQFDKAALSLGNLGASHQNVSYEQRSDIFTKIGFNQYNQYRLEIDALKFYKLNKAYNDLYFSPLGGQQNFLVKAKFSRNFDKKVNIAIDYQRIIQQDRYQDQNTKQTSLGLGLWKRNEKGTHQYFISFIANNFNETHNGGVSVSINDNPTYDDPIFRNQRTAIPIYLDNANGRHQYFSYALDNHLNTRNNKLKLQHRIQFEDGYYRYSDTDTNTAEDSLVYQSYITSDRGIRMVNNFFRLTNKFLVGLDLKQFKANLGIEHRLLKYKSSDLTDNFNDIALHGRLAGNIKDFIFLNAGAQIGVGQNIGNFKLNGSLTITPSKGINILGFFDLVRYDATRVKHNLLVTDQLVYENNFSKINEFTIGGHLDVKKLRLNLGIKSGVIDNPVAFNQEAIPAQRDGSVQYAQFTLKHYLNFKFIGLENELIFQDFSDNIFVLPRIYSIHNLYLQSHLFKKRLFATVGILYYNIDQENYARFMPVTGQFYPTTESIEYFNYSELYATFKVDQFRIFFKYENFTDLFQKRVHYQIIDYPQLDAHFRIGVRWLIQN